MHLLTIPRRSLGIDVFGKPSPLVAVPPRKAHKYLPRKYVTVSAAAFVRHPETVMLDFDDAGLVWVRHWAEVAIKHFRLRGFIILKSSEHCYHVVFDRKVTWDKNVSIINWMALYAKHPGLERWVRMQCIKGWPTLRISNKGKKPAPRVVFRYGKQEGQIREFLRFRRTTKDIRG